MNKEKNKEINFLESLKKQNPIQNINFYFIKLCKFGTEILKAIKILHQIKFKQHSMI